MDSTIFLNISVFFKFLLLIIFMNRLVNFELLFNGSFISRFYPSWAQYFVRPVHLVYFYEWKIRTGRHKLSYSFLDSFFHSSISVRDTAWKMSARKVSKWGHRGVCIESAATLEKCPSEHGFHGRDQLSVDWELFFTASPWIGWSFGERCENWQVTF